MSFKERLRAARMATQPKVTQAQIADALSVTPQAVSGWERGQAVPENDKLVRISEILKVDVGYLLGESPDKTPKNGPINPVSSSKKPPVATKVSHVNVADLADAKSGTVPISELLGDVDLPVFGTAEGGRGALIVTNEAVNWIVRPAPLLRVKDGYGIIVTGDSMSPAVRSGWVALVNPHLPPRAGDMCVFRNHQEDGTVLVCIKQLRRYNDTEWHVRQLNPNRDFALKRSEWQVCHVTVGTFYGL